jgi:hypothetical protein
MMKKISSPWTQHLLPSGERIQELDDFSHCISQVEYWRNQIFEEVEDSRSWSLKKSKFEEFKYWRSQRIEEVKDWSFGESTRVCDSSRVSGATDVGMPFGYPTD